MLEIRRSNERGFADHGWLKSYHTFSFGDYFDPQQVEFGALRVINEDRVAPAQGFGTHGHRDMEIISYVLDGELAHKDSVNSGNSGTGGNAGEVIRYGDVQRMSAGRGVMHSEFNASQQQPVHFLQIWIQPSERNIDPSYEQKYFAPEEKRGRLRLIASLDGVEGSVRIHQDVRVYAGLFDGAEHAQLEIGSHRQVYVHVARGAVRINDGIHDVELNAGDGLKLMDIKTLSVTKATAAEVLVFDLPRVAN